jgi:hypothetical protein
MRNTQIKMIAAAGTMPRKWPGANANIIRKKGVAPKIAPVTAIRAMTPTVFTRKLREAASVGGLVHYKPKPVSSSGR